ncbi:MAG: Trm112 family protein [Candidatus Auribacterota bacterium]|nr:Trm112 family protein [Candidatus Auribacterota bacterium]
MVDKKLLEILACPSCKSDIKLAENSLICTNNCCRRQYKIENDTPILLIDQALVLTPDNWNKKLSMRR